MGILDGLPLLGNLKGFDAVGAGDDGLGGVAGKGAHPVFSLEVQAVLRAKVGFEHHFHVVGRGGIGMRIRPGREDALHHASVAHDLPCEVRHLRGGAHEGLTGRLFGLARL